MVSILRRHGIFYSSAIDALWSNTGAAELDRLLDGLRHRTMDLPAASRSALERARLEEDFHGSDSFGYSVVDSEGQTAYACAMIDVGAVNDQPAPL